MKTMVCLVKDLFYHQLDSSRVMAKILIFLANIFLLLQVYTFHGAVLSVVTVIGTFNCKTLLVYIAKSLLLSNSIFILIFHHFLL